MSFSLSMNSCCPPPHYQRMKTEINWDQKMVTCSISSIASVWFTPVNLICSSKLAARQSVGWLRCSLSNRSSTNPKVLSRNQFPAATSQWKCQVRQIYFDSATKRQSARSRWETSRHHNTTGQREKGKDKFISPILATQRWAFGSEAALRLEDPEIRGLWRGRNGAVAILRQHHLRGPQSVLRIGGGARWDHFRPLRALQIRAEHILADHRGLLHRCRQLAIQ